MLKKVFSLLEDDLKKIKKSGFKLPEKRSDLSGVEREIAKDIVLPSLPENLRDVWLLFVYYCNNGHRYDVGNNGRTENQMKREIVTEILEFYLAPLAPNDRFDITDFWVDTEWNLFFLEEENAEAWLG